MNGPGGKVIYTPSRRESQQISGDYNVSGETCYLPGSSPWRFGTGKTGALKKRIDPAIS